MQQTTYRVAGMSCDHCVNAVQSELGAIPTVESVEVDLADGTVTVTSAEELERQVVADAVDEAGFDLVTA